MIKAIQAVQSESDSLTPSQEAYTESEQLELPLDKPDTGSISSATPEAFVTSIAPTAKAVAEELRYQPTVAIINIPNQNACEANSRIR